MALQGIQGRPVCGSGIWRRSGRVHACKESSRAERWEGFELKSVRTRRAFHRMAVAVMGLVENRPEVPGEE